MAIEAIFSSLRRRRAPFLEAFLAPVNLTEVSLVQTLTSVSMALVSSFSGKLLFFQRKNSRSLIRKIEFFVFLLEYVSDPMLDSGLPSSMVICLQELYLLLYRAKMLLDYCVKSSKLWLLLQNDSISGHFHDLNEEICTLLDVFPLIYVNLSKDIVEQIGLIRKQARKSLLYVDKNDDMGRMKLFFFLNEFESGRTPDVPELRSFFVDRLEIKDEKSCRDEIVFLEEQIVHHGGDVEPPASVLNGIVAITRYCKFLLFGLQENEVDLQCRIQMNLQKGMITHEIAETFLTIPTDFCCPISLDLMKDPVVVCSGQTYDRNSISRWLEEGHRSCPKTGQLLLNTALVPNRAMRNLIIQWCSAQGISCDPLDNADPYFSALPSMAAMEANKATAVLLVQHLANGSQGAKAIAACEIRLLAKTGKENRAFIAEAGAIPYLHSLLSSTNPIVQENSVTALLNLSIYDKNKSRIMDEEGCLGSIIDIVKTGVTTSARENAAATLFSLSAVHDYKKKIGDEEGAVEALAALLKVGMPRGKKDAVTALFNLSTHSENCMRMVESGVVAALVAALANVGVAEEAAGALALIVRQPIGAEAVGKEENAVPLLITMMRCGTPRGKENAVAALLELCRSGGAAAAERMLRTPALAGLLQSLLFTGTKRARRKAASLARVFQRCENHALHLGGLGPGLGYTFTGNSAANRNSSFIGDISVSMSISVPVS